MLGGRASGQGGEGLQRISGATILLGAIGPRPPLGPVDAGCTFPRGAWRGPRTRAWPRAASSAEAGDHNTTGSPAFRAPSALRVTGRTLPAFLVRSAGARQRGVVRRRSRTRCGRARLGGPLANVRSVIRGTSRQVAFSLMSRRSSGELRHDERLGGHPELGGPLGRLEKSGEVAGAAAVASHRVADRGDERLVVGVEIHAAVGVVRGRARRRRLRTRGLLRNPPHTGVTQTRHQGTRALKEGARSAGALTFC